MANISYWQASWVDAGETGLLPGQEHNWVMWGFGYGDAVAVTAAPLNSDAGDQILGNERAGQRARCALRET